MFVHQNVLSAIVAENVKLCYENVGLHLKYARPEIYVVVYVTYFPYLIKSAVQKKLMRNLYFPYDAINNNELECKAVNKIIKNIINLFF